MHSPTTEELAAHLRERIVGRKVALGVIGMGYVGLPLVVAAHKAGFSVVGFDINRERVALLNSGHSPIHSLTDELVKEIVDGGRFRASSDFSDLQYVDAIMICVPTPLSRHREPDLSYIERTGVSISKHLRHGQLVILESTTFPGTTQDILKPILERGGLKTGVDYFLAYSPEREDPGNPNFETSTIPRVVGGDDSLTADLVATLYRQIVTKVVPVSSCATAEAVKLTENIFRAVNIALVNELKLIYSEMGINIWEVIEAAKSKPFGFMPFYPGPGLGGHCIPIDPFYLTWKAREYGVSTRFIELAGEVNAAAPRHVLLALAEALSNRQRKSLNGARVLLLGLAYKKNVDDMRESPSLTLLDMLEEFGAEVDYFDPLIPVIPITREHIRLAGRKSIVWTREAISKYDVALISTDHDAVRYDELLEWLPLVIDTRNATKSAAANRHKIVLA